MPLKKKDRDRLFEKDLEKGESGLVQSAPFNFVDKYTRNKLFSALFNSAQLGRVIYDDLCSCTRTVSNVILSN